MALEAATAAGGNELRPVLRFPQIYAKMQKEFEKPLAHLRIQLKVLEKDAPESIIKPRGQ
jgi:hypothetical protein